MKKIFFLFLALQLFLTGSAFAAVQTNQGGNMNGDKLLIAYFSWGGNTKHIAEKIQSQAGGNMFRIETLTPYPADYNETAYGIAKKQHEEGTLPPLKDNGDVSQYDIIFIGTPAWWHEMAPAVKTFIAGNNFAGKTIVPFITHGGGGEYTIHEDMIKLSKGANVLKPLVIFGDGDSRTDDEIKDWLKQIQ